MLKTLLRLFPARFREEMGDDWMADNRQELEKAKRRGTLAVIGWAAQLIAGTLAGASISHVHQAKLSTTKSTIIAGNAVLVIGGSPSEQKNSLWLSITLSVAGALIVGHMAAELFIVFWIEGGVEKFNALFQQYELSSGMLVGLAPVALKIALLITGIYLAFSQRVRSNIKLLSWAHWGYLLLMVWMAASASFLHWTLRDIGDNSEHLTQMMEDYPIVRKEMGISTHEGKTRLHLYPGSVQCERARAVFSLASHNWLTKFGKSGELMPLILLQGISTQLWDVGCWDQKTLMDYNKSLVLAAQITPLMERRLKYQYMGQGEEIRNIILPSIGYSREQWCTNKVSYALDGRGDIAKTRAHCERILNAKDSVHTKGVYEPSDVELKKLTIPTKG